MVVVVDYRAGNLYNVGNALNFLKAEFQFSGDPEVVRQADKVILPGVGSAQAAMESLSQQGLVEVIRDLEVPFLGICLGLQLLYEVSEEENTPCLGLLPGTVQRFSDAKVKVPHIGWNQVEHMNEVSRPSPLFRNVPNHSFFYFVHSYCAPISDETTQGVTQYDRRFAAAVFTRNLWGVQFHPERSGELGLKVLNNFLEVDQPCW